MHHVASAGGCDPGPAHPAAPLPRQGLGCAAAVAALTWGDAPAAVFLCAACLVLAGSFYAPERGLTAGLGLGAVLLAVAAPWADRALDFRPTKTKALGRALDRGGAR